MHGWDADFLCPVVQTVVLTVIGGGGDHFLPFSLFSRPALPAIGTEAGSLKDEGKCCYWSERPISTLCWPMRGFQYGGPRLITELLTSYIPAEERWTSAVDSAFKNPSAAWEILIQRIENLPVIFTCSSRAKKQYELNWINRTENVLLYSPDINLYISLNLIVYCRIKQSAPFHFQR